MAVFFAGGTLLKIGDGGSPEAFVAAGQVRGGPEGPSNAFDLLDATHHGSPNRYREFVTGLADAEDVSFQLLYDPDDPTHDAATGLLAQAVGRSVANFEIVYPGVTASKSTTAFSAYVTQFRHSAPHDDLLVADVTLKVTGAPSYENSPT